MPLEVLVDVVRGAKRPIVALIVALLLGVVVSGCMSVSAKQEGKGPPSENPGNKPSIPPGQEKKQQPPGGFSDTSVFPGNYVVNGDSYSYVLQKGPFLPGREQVANVPIGENQSNVQIGYVLPTGGDVKQFPVIVVASVYLGHLTQDNLRKRYTSNPEETPSFLIDNYVSHGYAVAFVPVRGAAGNGGCYEWWSDAERHDLRAAIEWIKQQDWSKDSIGLIGLSLAGASAWMAAGFGDAAIKTIVPIASETDLYSWFVRNGTPSIIAAPFGTPAFWFLFSVSPMSTSTGVKPAHDPMKTHEGAACPGQASAIAAGQYMSLTGAPDPWKFTEVRDLRPAVEAHYNGSIFLVHGFNDWLAHPHLVYPWVNSLEERGVVVKHLLGQWRHRMPDDSGGGSYFQPTRRIDFAEILLHWFDYWLKGNTTVDLGPRVQVADSRLQWRNEDAWPPASTPMRMYLSDGTLGTTPAEDSSVRVAPDAGRALVRNDSFSSAADACLECPEFESGPFPDGLRFSGIPSLRVTARPQGVAGHVTAYLYAAGDDERRLVGWATMDLRFADDLDPAPLEPNKPVVADLAFEPLDVHLLPGERLVLELFQGGYGEDFGHFPVRALAPAAYYRSPTITNPVEIDLGGEQTYLVLPVIEVDESKFFTPPTLAS